MLRSSSIVCYWLAGLGASAGIGLQSSILVTVATLFAVLGLLIADVASARDGGLTVITLFSISSLGTAVANLVGLWARHTPNRDLYFVYVAEDYLFLAQELQFAQSVFPVLGFWLVTKRPAARLLSDLLPPIESRINVRLLTIGALVLSAAVILLNLPARPEFGGTPIYVLSVIPNIAAFVLARIGTAERNASALRAALVIALAEAVRALLFGFLRGTIAHPLLAFTLGALIGARSLRPLVRVTFIPILVAGLLFVWYYGLLGEVRGRYQSGWNKIADMAEYQSRRFDSPSAGPQQTVLARLTSYNQLSQIGRLVEQNGFYNGRTFEYLRYAFVPRFLWPDKPTIALGVWYAIEIGQAAPRADGWYNTSINMSSAGELYLNFGWWAVIPGLLVYGAVLGILWTRTSFWTQDARNILGGAFAVALAFGLILGAGESPLLVSLFAIYLCLFLVAAAWALATHGYAHLKARSRLGGGWLRLRALRLRVTCHSTFGAQS